MASMQRRIQQLEEQTSKGGNEKSGGLSRAAATLMVDKLHINEGISTQDREKLISEYMTPKDPSPDLKQEAQEMLDAMLGRD